MSAPVPVEHLPGFLHQLEKGQALMLQVVDQLYQNGVLYGQLLQRWEEKYPGVDWRNWVRNPSAAGAPYPTPDEILSAGGE